MSKGLVVWQKSCPHCDVLAVSLHMRPILNIKAPIVVEIMWHEKEMVANMSSIKRILWFVLEILMSYEFFDVFSKLMLGFTSEEKENSYLLII